MKKLIFLLFFALICSYSFAQNTVREDAKSSDKSSAYISAGTGVSFGNLGVQFKYITKGKFKVGVHGGVGYTPSNYGNILLSSGISFYLYKDIVFVDAQFGSFDTFSMTMETTQWNGYYYEKEYYNINGVLYGCSLMLGSEYFFNDHFGFNSAFGLSMDVDWYAGDVFLAYSFGFIYKF